MYALGLGLLTGETESLLISASFPFSSSSVCKASEVSYYTTSTSASQILGRRRSSSSTGKERGTSELEPFGAVVIVVLVEAHGEGVGRI